jgi:hypothetical protein
VLSRFVADGGSGVACRILGSLRRLRRLDPVTRRSPQLSALAASLLALAVATGVATPRLRTGGRERAARSAALAGTTRPDEPCPWIEPDADWAVAISAPAGDLVFDTVAVASYPDADHTATIVATAAVVTTPVSVLLATRPLRLASDRPARRPAAARGPPTFLA